MYWRRVGLVDTKIRGCWWEAKYPGIQAILITSQLLWRCYIKTRGQKHPRQSDEDKKPPEIRPAQPTENGIDSTKAIGMSRFGNSALWMGPRASPVWVWLFSKRATWFFQGCLRQCCWMRFVEDLLLFALNNKGFCVVHCGFVLDIEWFQGRPKK